MAKRAFFAIACLFLSVHATAWGQGPMQQGPMQQGPMMPGPMPQSAGEAMATGDPCAGGNQPSCACNQGIPEWEFFGDFLYIRPRNANVAYGVAAAPAAPTPIQIAQPGIASIDFHPGFRAGFAKTLDDCNAVVATYSHYEGENQDSISSPADNILPMVSHPVYAPIPWSQADSFYRMRFDLADVDFRWTFENQNDTRLSLFAGTRYAVLDQRLNVDFTYQGGVDAQNVHSQINFEGAGLRVGFDGQRRTPFGLMFYGRTAASLIAGTARCNFTQTSGNIGGPPVDTGYRADRVVPIIDAELGTGVSLLNDRLRITAGYSFSGWFNVVRTDQFIKAVQGNDFTGMHDTLTFDGFVGRVELDF